MTDKTVYTVHYDTTATKTLEVLGEAFRYRLLAKKGQWRVFARDLQVRGAVLASLQAVCVWQSLQDCWLFSGVLQLVP